MEDAFGYQKLFEADFRAECYVRAISDAFASPEPELTTMLDAWVQATPAWCPLPVPRLNSLISALDAPEGAVVASVPARALGRGRASASR